MLSAFLVAMGSIFCHPSRQSPSIQLFERYSSSLSQILHSSSFSYPSRRLCSSSSRWIWIFLQMNCLWIMIIPDFPRTIQDLWREFQWMDSYMLPKDDLNPLGFFCIWIEWDWRVFDNNFKMKGGKTQREKQKQKQKHELIFKYVKSFHNPEAEIYLQKLRMGPSEKKESILLNSKVFEVSVLASKHKKRVSFAENDVINEGRTPSKRQKTKNSKNTDKQPDKSCNEMQNCSPERVQSDLLELQRSIFTTFKIKQEAKPHPATYSSIKPSFQSQLQSDLAYHSLGPRISSLPLAESKVMRAKSCSTISQLALQSTAKPNPTRATTSMQGSVLIQSGLSRSLSQSSPPVLSRHSSQLSNPSSVYSQQSHNLMVEIFKQKLQNKRLP